MLESVVFGSIALPGFIAIIHSALAVVFEPFKRHPFEAPPRTAPKRPDMPPDGGRRGSIWRRGQFAALHGAAHAH